MPRHTVAFVLGILLIAFGASGQVFGRWNKNAEKKAAATRPVLLSLSLLPPDSECSGTPPNGVTFTRASAATCITSAGVAVALTANHARVHSTLGLLVEGAATNVLLQSRSANGVAWTGCLTPGSTTGMDNTTSVSTCATASTVSQAVTPAAGARTASVYVRNAGGLGCSVTLSADAETTGSVGVGDVGLWQRVSLPYTSDAAVNVSVTIGGAGCRLALDYAQDETGAIATSPIVTGGTAATRAGEVATVPTSGLSETSGCVALSVAPLWTGSTPSAVDLLTAGTSSTLLAYANAGGTNIAAYVGSGSPSAVAAGFAAGSAKRYRTTWSAAVGYRINNDTTAASGTLQPLTSWPAFGSDLYVGSRGAGSFSFSHLSNLVLGSTPEACQ